MDGTLGWDDVVAICRMSAGATATPARHDGSKFVRHAFEIIVLR
jgi:hypothetical protein